MSRKKAIMGKGQKEFAWWTKGIFFFPLSSNTKASDLECKEPATPGDSSVAGWAGGWLLRYRPLLQRLDNLSVYAPLTWLLLLLFVGCDLGSLWEGAWQGDPRLTGAASQGREGACTLQRLKNRSGGEGRMLSGWRRGLGREERDGLLAAPWL